MHSSEHLTGSHQSVLLPTPATVDRMEQLCNDMANAREEELGLIAAEASQQIIFKFAGSSEGEGSSTSVLGEIPSPIASLMFRLSACSCCWKHTHSHHPLWDTQPCEVLWPQGPLVEGFWVARGLQHWQLLRPKEKVPRRGQERWLLRRGLP